MVVDPLHQIGNVELLRTQFISAEKMNALKGRRIKKWFPSQGRFFEGTVVTIDEFYQIDYDDGDQEDVTLEELVDIILPPTEQEAETN